MRPSHLGLLTTAAQPAVSPDGRHIAFTVTRVDVAANTNRSQVWLATSDGSRPPRPVTSGDRRDADPTWSPDGTLLAFTSRRAKDDHVTTVHVLAVSVPGETVTVAEAKGGATSLVWSPDGRWLAFVSDALDPRYDEPDPAKQPPRKITRFFSRLDSKGWTHDRPSHVWVVRADGVGAPRDLTPGEFAFRSPAWLADSSGVVCAGAAHDTWDLDRAVDLHVVTLAGERRALTAQTGVYDLPSVSPDGTQVAFIGQDDPNLGVQNQRLGVVDLATGERRWLAAGLDRTFAPYPGARAPVWDGDAVLASYEDRGDVRVRRVPVGAGEARTLTPAERCVAGFDHRAGVLAVAVSRFDRPAELAAVTADGVEQVLTTLSDDLVREAHPLDAHRFTAPSTDGAEVDVWVVVPPGVDPADATASVPVLLNVHGGPHTQYGNKFFDEAQMQAAAGYLVVMSNPRGSSGREEAWGQAILGPKHATAGRGWGSVDVDDVLAALDETLRRFPCADPGRVGMLGGSYGGYMASWLAGHTTRFRAICSERAVNNLLTEEFTSDISTGFVEQFGVNHLDDPDEYRRMSPITYVKDIVTPMLLLHSEDDLRCPVNQAEELFVALRLLGKEVEFHRFPAESHELSRAGSPLHRRQRQEIIEEFFARHLSPSPKS